MCTSKGSGVCAPANRISARSRCRAVWSVWSRQLQVLIYMENAKTFYLRMCICPKALCLSASRGLFFFFFLKPHAQTCTGKQTPGTLGGKSLQNQANRWISILKCIFEYAVIFSNHLLSVRSRFSFTVVVKTGRRRRNLSALIQNGNHRIWLKRSSKH